MDWQCGDVLTIQIDVPGVGRNCADDHLKQSCLPSPVRTKERNRFAAVDMNADLGCDLAQAMSLREMISDKHWPKSFATKKPALTPIFATYSTVAAPSLRQPSPKLLNPARISSSLDELHRR
jgi:hypothetical protein